MITEVEAPNQSAASNPPEVKLSVIVPAYREGNRIYGNISRLLDELDLLDGILSLLISLIVHIEVGL